MDLTYYEFKRVIPSFRMSVMSMVGRLSRIVGELALTLYSRDVFILSHVIILTLMHMFHLIALDTFKEILR